MERYQNNLQDQFGNAVSGVTVTVRLESSGALASIFSDNLGTPTAKSNPFTNDADGELFFYAANERYDIFFTGPVTTQKDDVILDDPADDNVTGFVIAEKTTALANVAGFGEVWVRDDVPNVLVFTDDAGTDFVIGGAGTGLTSLTEDLTTAGGDLLTADPSTGNAPLTLLRMINVGVGAIGLEIGGDAGSAASNWSVWRSVDQTGTQWWECIDDHSLSSSNHRLSWRNQAGQKFIELDNSGEILIGGGLGGEKLFLDITNDKVAVRNATLYIEEAAAAGGDLAGEGQIWVKTATPNELWFTDDAGTDFSISNPSILYNGLTAIATALTDGLEIRGDSANDPTAGALQNTQIELANSSGAPVADIGFASVATFNISSRVHGAPIVLSAEDSAGVIRTIINADPDAVSSFRADTDLELLVNASESALIARANGEVELYWDGQENFRTSDESASDIGMGAEIRHNDDNFYPVGMNVAPEDAGLDSGNVTLGQEHVGLMLTYNTGTEIGRAHV